LCDSKHKPAVIAVIDTGLKKTDESVNAHLCKYGHKDFTSQRMFSKFPGIPTPVPTDIHGHGTNVVGLIDQYAGEKNYCIVILKYYEDTPASDNMRNTLEALQYAINIGAKYINYSGGGGQFSPSENRLVKQFLNKGGRFIAAAGNESQDIDAFPYYPAKDDERVITVGNVNSDGTVASSSNYGDSVTRWENGQNRTAFGVTMSGTSQATAVATGKIINEQECDK
jgi:hypothetical protein